MKPKIPDNIESGRFFQLALSEIKERQVLRVVADSRLSDVDLSSAIEEGLALALQGAQRGLAMKRRDLD